MKIERYQLRENDLNLRLIKLSNEKEKFLVIDLSNRGVAYGKLAKEIFEAYDSKNFNKIKQLLNRMYRSACL